MTVRRREEAKRGWGHNPSLEVLKKRVLEEKEVLRGTNSYEQKYYFNEEFRGLPEGIRQELQVMCVPYAEDVGGILIMEFDEDDSLEFKVVAPEEDYLFDEVGSMLKTKQYQLGKRELLEALELYYKVFFLRQELEEEWFVKLTIGNVALDSNPILVPMTGVTDLSFRLPCKEQGCGLMCTEMISAEAIYYKNKNTVPLLEVREEERSIAVQLFDSDPVTMSEMAKQIEDGSYDVIDINMGCLVPKVVNNGEGSALMKGPKLVEGILTAMVKALKKPVTIKFRRGFDETCVNVVEIAKIAESYGVAAVVVHGRTREQYYPGKADWGVIRQVKKAAKIPVIGNGDIFTPQDAKRMLEETGCDGLTIARGVKGNPWIFQEINRYLDTGELPPRPEREEIWEMLLRRASLQMEYEGECPGIREMRKYVAQYAAGLPHLSALRNEVNQVESYEDFKALVMHKIQRK